MSWAIALAQLVHPYGLPLEDFYLRKYLNAAFRLRSTLRTCGLSEAEAQTNE